MTNQYKILTYALLSIISFSSCKKFISISSPKTQLVTASVFSNNSTANAAQMAIYSQMANGGSYDISLNAGLSADEFNNYYTQGDYLQFYTNSLNSTNGFLYSLWSEDYSYIYNANAEIAGLQNNSLIDTAVKQQLLGEAKFVRAFWYFYLTNLFGNVPLLLTTNFQVNTIAKSTPTAQVYQQITEDLKDAQNLLNNNFVEADGITTKSTTDRIRPTKWAAAALLARVYLFQQDWLNAETQSTLIINNSTLFTLQNDLNNVFLANSREAILQLQPPVNATGYNTTEGSNFISTSTPYTVTLSDQILNAFESGDQRLVNWVSNYNDGTQTYYFPYKYKVQFSSVLTEYTMVLRLAEQYLIRAEARAQQGNITGANSAASDLNIIRNRAGLLPTTAQTLSEILKAIYHEKQVELFTEWGQRWLDLKRTNWVDTIMTSATSLKGGRWNTSQQLYPIPQNERNSDPNLSQNAGY